MYMAQTDTTSEVAIVGFSLGNQDVPAGRHKLLLILVVAHRFDGICFF